MRRLQHPGDPFHVVICERLDGMVCEERISGRERARWRGNKQMKERMNAGRLFVVTFFISPLSISFQNCLLSYLLLQSSSFFFFLLSPFFFLLLRVPFSFLNRPKGIGEGLLPLVKFAQKSLLAEGAAVVPSRVSLYATLAYVSLAHQDRHPVSNSLPRTTRILSSLPCHSATFFLPSNKNEQKIKRSLKLGWRITGPPGPPCWTARSVAMPCRSLRCNERH